MRRLRIQTPPDTLPQGNGSLAGVLNPWQMARKQGETAAPEALAIDGCQGSAGSNPV